MAGPARFTPAARRPGKTAASIGTEWDRRFGPLLDGSAFKDSPRGAVPVETFYLPLNENWPMSIDRGFTGGYWPDDALTAPYRAQLVEASRQIAEHVAQHGWTNTVFEFFLNGKVYYKQQSWSRCSSPWIFDEPVNAQDFAALRWYGLAFHEGLAQALRRRWRIAHGRGSPSAAISHGPSGSATCSTASSTWTWSEATRSPRTTEWSWTAKPRTANSR